MIFFQLDLAINQTCALLLRGDTKAAYARLGSIVWGFFNVVVVFFKSSLVIFEVVLEPRHEVTPCLTASGVVCNPNTKR